MKPARFEYVAPRAADEVTQIKREYGDEATIMAGGLSLMPMLNMRVVSPALVVDLARVSSLDFCHADDAGVEIGALWTQAGLLGHAKALQALPMLGAVLSCVGHYQTRDRGTVCGSLAHADPSAEIPLLASVLEATVTLRSANGTRSLPARDFLVGMLETACADDEWVESVRIPALPTKSWFFDEYSLRRGDFALTACLAVRREDGIRLGISGVAGTPIVRDLAGVESSHAGELANQITEEIDFSMFAAQGERYRRRASSNLIRRAFEALR